MRVLVTGADGFVGQALLPVLARAGHEVLAAVRSAAPALATGGIGAWRGRVVPLELTEPDSVAAALALAPDAVVHLAAVASNRSAAADPDGAWLVNAAGTARLCRLALTGRPPGAPGPLLLVVSSGEVYGPGSEAPRTEDQCCRPLTPYAASKLAAEVAALSTARGEGLRVIVARPFTHTGPGQPEGFVVPGFARRIREARDAGRDTVAVGNLQPVRDLLDVRDVAEAYRLLLERGEPGETYNVATGTGHSLASVFERLARALGAAVRPAPDPALARALDLPHLVGDPTRLMVATGWRPTHTLEQTLADVIDAQAH